MSSMRLRPDQVEALKRFERPADVIHCAVRRWLKGEIVIGNNRKKENGAKLLLFPIWRKPDGLRDDEIRAILDAHLQTPIDYSKQIAENDRLIAELFSALPQYIEGENGTIL